MYEEAVGRRGKREDVALRRVIHRLEPDRIMAVVFDPQTSTFKPAGWEAPQRLYVVPKSAEDHEIEE